MKNLINIALFFLCSFSASAHKSWQMHAQDMYEVLQLAEDARLTEWMRYVSSELIDGYDSECLYSNNGLNKESEDGVSMNFRAYIRNKYGLKVPHRCYYHWGFNSKPWSYFFEKKVNGWEKSRVDSLKNDLIAEQKRRNGIANEKTETLFGYAHSGREARIANVILSVVYDCHVLGDYEPDNKLLDGLQDISAVVTDLCARIRALDAVTGKNLIKELQDINKKDIDIKQKALMLNICLKQGFSKVLMTAQNGEIKRHLESLGFSFCEREVRTTVIND